MEQEKIGKFIAECRKEKGLTQMQLAEQLGITNRAISKWENGKSMPDVSIMIPLCEILDISVNELLSGEKIKVEDYKSKADQTLIEMKKQEEKAEQALSSYRTIVYILGILFALLLIFSVYTGTQVGSDLGEFIYNITH